MGNAIEHFAIPGLSPKPVQEASARFEQISADFQATRTRFYALKAARLDDIAAANMAAAEARVEGSAPPKMTPDKIDVAIIKAEQEMNVLHEACDLAHTALMEAIAQHRDEWLTKLDEVDRAANERLRVALIEARAAVADLQVARTAPEWVRSFVVSTGQTQWSGGRGIGHTNALDDLDKIVTPDKKLVGYRDDDGDGTSEPIFEDVIA
jgi:hypothetical protein